MYWKKSFPLLSILPLSSRIIGNVCERLKSSLARVIFFFFFFDVRMKFFGRRNHMIPVSKAQHPRGIQGSECCIWEELCESGEGL